MATSPPSALAPTTTDVQGVDGPVGSYQERPFPLIQRSVGDLFRFSRKKHYVCAILEADVTVARDRLRRLEVQSGERLSFTAWLAACLAQAIHDFPATNTYRKGSRATVAFSDVDVLIVIEREVGEDRRPLPYVIRTANQKSVEDIHREIRSVQRGRLQDEVKAIREQTSRDPKSILARLSNPYRLPDFIRGLYWNGFRTDPFRVKRVMGTTGITSVGMFARGGGWPVVPGVHTVDVAVGGIARKPGVAQDQIMIREVLDLSVQVDHEMVDGVPAAQFCTRFVELMETAFGLEGSQQRTGSDTRSK